MQLRGSKWDEAGASCVLTLRLTGVAASDDDLATQLRHVVARTLQLRLQNVAALLLPKWDQAELALGFYPAPSAQTSSSPERDRARALYTQHALWQRQGATFRAQPGPLAANARHLEGTDTL